MKTHRVDRSSADVAKNLGRYTPQRTSATREIAVSLPMNVVTIVKAHRPQCHVLDRWRAKFRRNGLVGSDCPDSSRVSPNSNLLQRCLLGRVRTDEDNSTDHRLPTSCVWGSFVRHPRVHRNPRLYGSPAGNWADRRLLRGLPDLDFVPVQVELTMESKAVALIFSEGARPLIQLRPTGPCSRPRLSNT